MVILFLMYAIDLVAEYFEMVPQDIIYIRCRGQSLAADFFQDFKDFPFRRGTDIEATTDAGASGTDAVLSDGCIRAKQFFFISDKVFGAFLFINSIDVVFV